MKEKDNNFKKRSMALGQILVLLIGIVGIAYAFESSIGVVSAEITAGTVTPSATGQRCNTITGDGLPITPCPTGYTCDGNSIDRQGLGIWGACYSSSGTTTVSNGQATITTAISTTTSVSTTTPPTATSPLSCSGVSKPKQMSATAFCYYGSGGDSAGTVLYTVSSSSGIPVITRQTDGRTYMKNSNGGWDYYINGADKGSVDTTTEGKADLGEFDNLANGVSGSASNPVSVPGTQPPSTSTVPTSSGYHVPPSNALDQLGVSNSNTGTSSNTGEATGNPGASTSNSQGLRSPEQASDTISNSDITSINSQLKKAGSSLTEQDLAKQCASSSDVRGCIIDKASNIIKNPSSTASISAGQAIIGIGKSAVYAGGIYAAFATAKSFFGVQPGSTWDEVLTGAQWAATGFTFGSTLPKALLKKIGITSTQAGEIGAGIAIVGYLMSYQKETQVAVSFSCVPWEPPVGGQNCGQCGVDGTLCTSYQCSSLGQACQLLSNPNGKPVCVWVDKNDVTPPTISWNPDALSQGYTATAGSAQGINPPPQGEIINQNVSAFSQFSFGIKTDKMSKCKVGFSSSDSYGNMTNYLGGANWGTTHNVTIPIFEPTSNGTSISNSGNTELFIRCQTPNGYSNNAPFVVDFNVSNTPDHTAPTIKGTDILNGAPVAYGINSTNVTVYVSEPVTNCEWNHEDVAYQLGTKMDCSAAKQVGQVVTTGPYAGDYACVANLTGIKSRATNDFYFKCNDTSGNVDVNATKFSLQGTQPLVINSVTPNQTTIKDSTQSIKITLKASTSAGYNKGQATCMYANESQNPSDPNSYTVFTNTSSYVSTADLWLLGGTVNPIPYTYYVKCVDLAGNAAYTKVTFDVQTDNQAPTVVRAYHDTSTNTLNIITSENATCVYDSVDCNYPFSSGTPMTTVDGITQSTDWSTNMDYYIKCKDMFNNQPPQNNCTVIVRPIQF